MAGRFTTRLGKEETVRFDEPVTITVLAINRDSVELCVESSTGERVRCHKVGKPSVLEKALTKTNNS